MIYEVLDDSIPLTNDVVYTIVGRRAQSPTATAVASLPFVGLCRGLSPAGTSCCGSMAKGNSPTAIFQSCEKSKNNSCVY